MKTTARIFRSCLAAVTVTLALSGCEKPGMRRATAVATYCADSKVEIVAVHGLNGKSWTAQCGETMYACTSYDAREIVRAQCTEKGD